MSIPFPILVVSYSDDSRNALVGSLQQLEVPAVACATFLEAEELALQGVYNGMLVDLPSMIKAKGEEKVVACSLAGFYPTLRVRAMGSFLVPMIMPGGAKQDASLKEFLVKSCANFIPRKLRAHKRHALCVAAVVGEDRDHAFTLDLSWGGTFIVHMQAEKFAPNQLLDVYFPEFDLQTRVMVRWVQAWGGRRAPGIGCQFLDLEEKLAALLGNLLRCSQEHDRDRLLA